MGKRIALTIVTACVLLITGCGASNSIEDSAGVDSQIAEKCGTNRYRGKSSIRKH